jgi:hypothetical protein
MAKHKIRHLAVTVEGKIEGILPFKDLVSHRVVMGKSSFCGFLFVMLSLSKYLRVRFVKE